MSQPLQVLVVVNRSSDAEPWLAALRQAGFGPEWQALDNEQQLLEALKTQPDVVLADYQLPRFGAARLLDLVRQRSLDIPVIFISGSVGEEAAVDALHGGAADFVLSSRLGRLGPAVRSALRRRGLLAQQRSAEDALRASEERLRLALNAGRMGLWQWDPRTKLAIWNEREYELLGLPVGNGLAPADAFFQSIHPDDVDRIRAEVQRCFDAWTDLNTEMRIVRPDGQVRWLGGRGRVYRDSAGRPVQMVGVNYDITESKLAEQALRNSQLMLESVMNNIPQGVFWKDRNSVYLGCNSVVLKSRGFSHPDQLVGKTDFELPGLTPEQAAYFVEKDRQVMETNTPQLGIVEPMTLADGSTIWLETSKLPMHDAENCVIGVLGTWQDVTERKRNEERLRASEERLAEAQRIARVGSWEWEIATGQLWWSPMLYSLFGVDPATYVPHLDKFAELVHPDDWPRLMGAAREHVRTGTPFNLEHRIRRPDGGELVVHVVLQREIDASGNTVRVRGVARDVTEQHRLEEQLRQSQKMEAIGRLAGGVAHDFNNLLTVILGYSELALSAIRDDDEEARAHVAAIRDAGERASALTRQLLAFSRKQLLEPKVLDLNEVISGSEKLLRRLIGEDVLLMTVLAPSLPKVKVDPSQIEQVILNLVVNARDAMPGGGRVTIETRVTEVSSREAIGRKTAEDGDVRPGRYVRLSVRDTGGGMPPEVLARVFEPFYTTKGPGRGIGLGLATVYGIVKQSDGWIDVASEMGSGTSFEVFLPAVEATERALATEPAGAGLLAGRETLLLVEDDLAVRVLTRAALEKCGYRVLEAAGGQEALQIAESHPGSIDLLISDVVMPEMSGRQLAETLTPKRQNMKVLLVSGYTEDARLRHDIAEANSAFLQKPFTLATLARKAREVLDQPA